MMTRKNALIYMKIAGYHSDTKAFIRLLVENRISRKIAEDAYQLGAKERERGVGCTCWDCRQSNEGQS